MGDPDHFMDRTIPYLKFCFTRGFVLASLVMFAIYFVVIGLKWDELAHAISGLYRFDLTAGEFLVFWLTGTVIIAAPRAGPRLHLQVFRRAGP